MQFLQSHPFAVEAHFDVSIVLTFALPKEQLLHRIPPCFELDLHKDTWGFLAVALVKTRQLRPKGFPAFLGNDFFLIGYRIFVRYTTSKGKRLRGLYILESATNKKKMERLGSLFTRYNYNTVDIKLDEHANGSSVSSNSGKLFLDYDRPDTMVDLPVNSPFADWKEARKYAGPLPFTFSFLETERKVLLVEGVRMNWNPRPVKVNQHRIGMLDDWQLNGAVLASAFELINIPYCWKKGIKDPWKQND